MLKIHRISAFDNIVSVYNNWHPFYDKTGNIENYFGNWMRNYPNLVGMNEADWIYLPIRFVNFRRTNCMAAAKKILNDIPNFKNKSQKCFTVCQWVDGVGMPLHNTKCFMATARTKQHISIPLCSDVHPKSSGRKTMLASFVGQYVTHPLRKRLAVATKNCSNIRVVNVAKDLGLFRQLLNSSTFTLCPRGVGPGSFRVFEAFHVGSVPVIISDDYRRPYADEVDWNEFSVSIPEADLGNIEKILKLKAAEAPAMAKRGEQFFADYCARDKVCERIIGKLK